MSNDTLYDKLAVKDIKTQSDYLADNIREMIISREFEDGYTFPNETEFCKILNVSRATLREAYKILDTQGYIKRTKHGTSIRKREEIAKDGNFVASLELADKEEVQEFICAVEPEAAYLAAQKADAEGIKRLEELMEECEAASGTDTRVFLKANGKFHAQIRNLAKNTLITSAMQAYYETFNAQIVENIYYRGDDVSEFRENSLKQHREILEAIKAGDADRAKKAAFDHLRYDVEYNQLKSLEN